MRTRYLLSAILLCRAAAAPCAVRAEDEFRVATVDVNKILNSLEDAKRKKGELDKMSQAAKQEVEKKRERVKTLEQKFTAQKAGPESEEAEALRGAIRDYERSVSDAEEDLKRAFLKVNRDLTDKVMKAVQAYANRNKIDLVLDKSAKGPSAVLYGDSSADITDAVLKEVGG